MRKTYTFPHFLYLFTAFDDLGYLFKRLIQPETGLGGRYQHIARAAFECRRDIYNATLYLCAGKLIRLGCDYRKWNDMVVEKFYHLSVVGGGRNRNRANPPK